MPSPRIKVGVVFGGASGEHDVSILSARTVIKALQSQTNGTRFEVIPFYIDLEGRWWAKEVAQEVLRTKLRLKYERLTEPLPQAGLLDFPKGSKEIQVWFPVLHGPNGEDGCVQGLFRLMRRPFVGSGVLGSAIGMDKLAMKAALGAAGFSQVPYSAFNASLLNNPYALNKKIKQIEEELCYPHFIKPANLGSSVGITKANNREELIKGLNKASEYDQRIIIEQGVNARELECAVLENDELKASVIGEIRFNNEWYDYETKYSEGMSHPIIPAPLTKEITQKIQLQAIQACNALAITSLARVDFFYEPYLEKVWINEINTMPGFTSKSMYPMLWEASGVTVDELVSKLVYTARE